MVNPKIARARLREKAIQEGDGFGYPVSSKEFDEAYEIYLRKVIRDYPGDSEHERDLRAVRSVGIYLWRKKTLEQLLPDLFSEGLSPIAEETPASTSTDAARLEEAEKAPIISTPAQHSPATQATTMIAGIPLADWLHLKAADPETAQDLMKSWKIEQAEKKAKDLELEQRMTDKEKNTSDRIATESHSQAVERAAMTETDENEKKNTPNSTVTVIHVGRVWMAPTAAKYPESSAALNSSNDTEESVQNTTQEGKIFGNENTEYKEHRFKKYRSQKQASRFQH
ncbi:uncharacterized protein Bfra_001484 [Botrytis fragariae]|uniref:Uncharacterized protein n=1 Tax=Botrytis fragariae TaxID=1964551 RepID=A0A8H6B114_9HELO|nr:uncharacterized protein Bfra_001484 [Botrytis fragariae]KAF5877122.1 hypothetical protein Bfra_001484 [Botrytis fragariae]